MAILVLIIIGLVICLIIGNDDQKPKKTTHTSQSKDDKEFEDMYFNGASGDDIDDF